MQTIWIYFTLVSSLTNQCLAITGICCLKQIRTTALLLAWLPCSRRGCAANARSNGELTALSRFWHAHSPHPYHTPWSQNGGNAPLSFVASAPVCEDFRAKIRPTSANSSAGKSWIHTYTHSTTMSMRYTRALASQVSARVCSSETNKWAVTIPTGAFH